MYASKADGYGGDHVAVESDGGGEDFMRAPDLATAVEASPSTPSRERRSLIDVNNGGMVSTS